MESEDEHHRRCWRDGLQAPSLLERTADEATTRIIIPASDNMPQFETTISLNYFSTRVVPKSAYSVSSRKQWYGTIEEYECTVQYV